MSDSHGTGYHNCILGIKRHKRHLGELVEDAFDGRTVYLHMVEIGMPGCCIHVWAKVQFKFSFPGLCSLDII